MSRQTLSYQLMGLILIALLLTECGGQILGQLGKAENEMISISFDGRGCTASGPIELPPGTHSVVLKDQSVENVDLWVSLLLDDHAYRDLQEAQSKPGEYFPMPNWVVQAVDFGSIWDHSLEGEVHRFLLDQQGEYALYVGRYDPDRLWFCTPVWVVDSPSG